MNSDILRYDESQIPEGYIMVRGMGVPQYQIEQVEQLYNAKLIPETTISDRALIMRLDEELARHIAKTGEEPEFIKFIDISDSYFKHMPLLSQVANIPVPITEKPAWFRFIRKFSVSLPN